MNFSLVHTLKKTILLVGMISLELNLMKEWFARHYFKLAPLSVVAIVIIDYLKISGHLKFLSFVLISLLCTFGFIVSLCSTEIERDNEK